MWAVAAPPTLPRMLPAWLPRAALLVLLAAAVMVSAPAGAHAAKVKAAEKPDLAAKALSAPRYAHAGGELLVQLQVAAAAGSPAKSTGVRVYLSADAKRGKGDQRLASAKAPKLKGGRKATVALRALVPAGQAAGDRHLVACVDDPAKVRERREANNCRAAVVTITAKADATRTSAALIAADLAAGKLTTEQALLRRAQAAMGDPRLPARYAGDVVEGQEDHAVLRQVADAWPTLSASTRKALTAYFAPPRDPRNDAAQLAKAKRKHQAKRKGKARAAQAGAEGWDPQTNPCVTNEYFIDDWRSVPAAGGKIRVSWMGRRPQDEAMARAIVEPLTVAYARFTEIMGREPLRDDQVPCWHGPDGSGALDVYLVDMQGKYGMTVPAAKTKFNSPDCDGMASFVMIDSTPGKTFTPRFTAAHELFHAFQNAFPYRLGCEHYSWFDEGSATWAAHAVFPDDDSEHFFTRALEEPGAGWTSLDYPSWPLMLWMDKTFGERSIGAAYGHFAAFGPVNSIDRAIGGVRQHFLDWAKAAWNQSPLDPAFVGWDRFAVKPEAEVKQLSLGGAKQQTVEVAADTGWLARQYHPLKVADDQVRELTFKNPVRGDADFRVGALLTLAGGETRFEDWSGRDKVTLCRDKAAENVTDVVLMYGVTDIDKDRSVSAKPTLGLRDSCDDFPWHFKVLSASHETLTDASMPGSSSASYCGMAGGLPVRDVDTFKASISTESFDAEDQVVLDAEEGSLDGSVYVDAPAAWHDELTGCTSHEDGSVTPCAKALDRTPTPEPTWGIGFHVRAASKDPNASATLTWTILDPYGGFVDGDNEICNVGPMMVSLEERHQRQDVPLSTLAGTAPFTLSFQGGDQWTTDALGNAATIVATWKYTMTLQRVDAGGRPL